MAGGTGYFWKGLGDSFNGFRDYKFKKDLQSDDNLLKMNEGMADRASREGIARTQHSDSGNQLKLDAVQRAAQGLMTLSYNKNKLADALLTPDPLNNKPITQDAINRARAYSAEATEHENQAAQMLAGIQTTMGPAFNGVPTGGGEKSGFRALLESMSGGASPAASGSASSGPKVLNGGLMVNNPADAEKVLSSGLVINDAPGQSITGGIPGYPTPILPPRPRGIVYPTGADYAKVAGSSSDETKKRRGFWSSLSGGR